MTTVSRAPVPRGPAAFDAARLRAEFPILSTTAHGKPLVYLDNAATSQKPRAVIDRLERYYTTENANVHRGVYDLSERATAEYERAREKARAFVNAASTREIVFVRGTTEGINLVASSWGRSSLQPGDEVLVSAMEHHSDIVPWQLVCEERGAVVRVIPMNRRGELLLEEYERLLTDRARIVAVAHVSNSLGTVNPIADMVRLAHARGIPVLVDGAQAAPHLRIDVQALGADFYTVSGHKMFGPTGIGVLYGREALLEAMPPYQGGGDMIKSVTFEETIYNDLPHKFEAGTPSIASGMGLGAAVDYINQINLDAVAAFEHDLLAYATDALLKIPRVRIIGRAKEKASVLSFVIDGIHPHDIGTVLDMEGVAIRTGHHCAQPVMQRFGIPATARASFAFYNTKEEVDILVKGIEKVIEVLG